MACQWIISVVALALCITTLNAWKPTQIVNSQAAIDSNANDNNPKVATDFAGKWITVWGSQLFNIGTFVSLGNDFDILFANSTDDGSTWSVCSYVNQDATNDTAADVFPDIAYANGRWVVVWVNQPETDGATYGDIRTAYSTDGIVWSPPAQLNIPSPTADDEGPQVAHLGGNVWGAVWFVDGLGAGIIKFARSTDNGVTWGGETNITSSGTNWYPDITYSDGNVVLVWEARAPATSTFHITYSISSNQGESWSTPTKITTTGSNEFPAIACGGNNTFLVVWESKGSTVPCVSGSDLDILYSMSTNGGTSWSSPQRVNQNADNDGTVDDELPRLDTTQTGIWVVVWSSNGQTIVNYAVSYDNAATWSDPLPLDNGMGSDSNTEQDIATSRSGSWVAAWQSDRKTVGTENIGSDPDILAVGCSNCFNSASKGNSCVIAPAPGASTGSTSGATTATASTGLTTPSTTGTSATTSSSTPGTTSSSPATTSSSTPATTSSAPVTTSRTSAASRFGSIAFVLLLSLLAFLFVGLN